MVKTNQRATQNSRVKPLTFATPIVKDESITSWLVRAALRQGCTPLTLTFWFWPDYRIWTYDADKGFEHLDHNIHKDMAVLARGIVEDFDEQNLVNFARETNNSESRKISLAWTQPLSKRNRYARFGYPYCPDCMANDKGAYLKLKWRFTWSVCCTEHRRFLQSECSSCHAPYQPQLSNPEDRFINHCHACRSKIDAVVIEKKPSGAIYQFQQVADKVFIEKEGSVLGKMVDISEWFEYLSFLINMVRIAARNPDYMFGKLLCELGIDVKTISLPKTALRFDYLPLEERVILLENAYYLFQISGADWVKSCQALNVTQNSFQWSKETVIPKAFHEVYKHLVRTQTRTYKAQSSDINPTSPDAVMAAWHRLQRKIEMTENYEKHLNKD